MPLMSDSQTGLCLNPAFTEEKIPKSKRWFDKPTYGGNLFSASSKKLET